MCCDAICKVFRFSVDEIGVIIAFIYLLITQGISTTIVLVRVEMGVSYDHATSKTANSANSGRPIQLAPFASKLNQTSSAIDFVGLDDERSERRLEPNRYTGT